MKEYRKSGQYACLLDSFGGEYVSDIDEWKTKWPDGVISYGVLKTSENSFNLGMTKDYVERAMTVALRVWALRTNDIKFRLIKDTTRELPDIPLSFVKAENDELFNDSPSVLAYAYFPTSSKIGGDMVFNDSKPWSKDGASYTMVDAYNKGIIKSYDPRFPNSRVKTYLLVHTLIHELGHALGLKHDEATKDAVMYPYYNEKIKLHTRDVNRIQLFYNKRPLEQRWLDYFEARLAAGIIR